MERTLPPTPSAALALALIVGLGIPSPGASQVQQSPPKGDAAAAGGSAAKGGSATGAGAKPDSAAKAAGGAKPFKPEEIEAIVAPIALYPDALIPQILMASTYPLEVVQAARWAKANKSLKGDALGKELEKQDWDPSVKSLIDQPQILTMLDEKLDWTRKLGDAVLAQQDDVMAAIQRLRKKAVDEGNLESSKEQKVEVKDQIIVIESTSPEVIYVPTYNPTVVYGGWPYPTYPPYSYYPPGYTAGAALLSFSAGVAVGMAWGYAWGNCNWGHSEIDIDIDHNHNINRNTNIDRSKYDRAGATSQGRTWQHDPAHRKGASYRDTATAQRFGKSPSAGTAQSREAYRGRAESMQRDLSRAGSQPSARQGASPSSRASSGAASSRASSRSTPSASSRSSAFDGYNRGPSLQAQSQRGVQSRSSSGGARSGGGGGGGARRGGGRR